MKSSWFKETNKLLGRPSNMTDEECAALHVYTDEIDCISKWKASLWERLRFLFTGTIWLYVHSGHTQPPVALEMDFPFVGE